MGAYDAGAEVARDGSLMMGVSLGCGVIDGAEGISVDDEIIFSGIDGYGKEHDTRIGTAITEN